MIDQLLNHLYLLCTVVYCSYFNCLCIISWELLLYSCFFPGQDGIRIYSHLQFRGMSILIVFDIDRFPAKELSLFVDLSFHLFIN